MPAFFATVDAPQRKANCAVLLGAWLIIHELWDADSAYKPLQQAEPYTPFRDASCGPSQFNLTVQHVLQVRVC